MLAISQELNSKGLFTKTKRKSSSFSCVHVLHQTILGDPGAVSRVGRKGGTKVFKYGRRPTLIELFPNIQADAGS